MTGSSIVLPCPLGEPVDELWEVLLDLGETNLRWTLVGGQMVLLHAVEHGTVPVQVSQDGDVVADIRAEPKSIKKIVGLLEDMGFELEGVNTDGVGHRYVRPGREGLPVKIDVLAPEGVGGKADLTTTKPGRTVQVPAGTQLLNRTERVTVTHGNRTGVVPRPTLLVSGHHREGGRLQDHWRGQLPRRAVNKIGIAAASQGSFADVFTKSAVEAGLGEVLSDGRITLYPRGERIAPAPDETGTKGSLTDAAFRVSTTRSGSATRSTPVLDQRWSLGPDGEVAFTISLDRPLSAADFASIGAVVQQVERLVDGLRAEDASG